MTVSTCMMIMEKSSCEAFYYNRYACILFCPCRADGISIAITSCCLETDGAANSQQPHHSSSGIASWHESFRWCDVHSYTRHLRYRFDTRSIDQDGWLVVELYAVDGPIDQADLIADHAALQELCTEWVGRRFSWVRTCIVCSVEVHHELPLNEQYTKVAPEKRVEVLTAEVIRFTVYAR